MSATEPQDTGKPERDVAALGGMSVIGNARGEFRLIKILDGDVVFVETNETEEGEPSFTPMRVVNGRLTDL